jgi:mannitol/fructose-specific phosphotransferase system IIA component (Ntr-type)
VRFEDAAEPVTSLFVLAATPDQRNTHLKALSAISQIWQSAAFESRWRAATGEAQLRQILLDAPRQRTR